MAEAEGLVVVCRESGIVQRVEIIDIGKFERSSKAGVYCSAFTIIVECVKH